MQLIEKQNVFKVQIQIKLTEGLIDKMAQYALKLQ